MAKKKQIETRINHSTYRSPKGFKSFAQPTERASTVIFDSVNDMRSRQWMNRSSYTYGLHGTPTTYKLEAVLADIEGAKHCVLAPSGLAAITIVDFALLKSGDDVLLPENIYNPNRELGNWLSNDFNISARYYNPLDIDSLKGMIQDNTKLIWTENPGSITMEVIDLPKIVKIAHKKNIIVALDNTWSAGLTYDGFAHGADIVVHALTKYQSGGSDLLMGAVLTRDKKLAEKLDTAHMRLGMGVGADDVYSVLRSLPSLKVRYEASANSAMQIAKWLKKQTAISKVLHPAFKDCPGYKIFERDFKGPGALFSVLFDKKYKKEQVHRFVESLKFFKMGYSWGGSHSLAVPYDIRGDRADWKYRDHQLVRFYIGLESPIDLIADLEQALSQLKS